MRNVTAQTLPTTPLRLKSPTGEILYAILADGFSPGPCAVRIDRRVWVGYGYQLSEFCIVLDTINGVAVFDLRAVQLLRLLE